MAARLTPPLLAAFFAFGTVMAALAGLSLIAPSLPFAWMWSLKQSEYDRMLAMGPIVGAGFLLLAALLAAAAWGCAHRSRLGWALGAALIAINAAGDAIRAATGGVTEGLTGVLIAGALLLWLWRPEVRSQFRP